MPVIDIVHAFPADISRQVVIFVYLKKQSYEIIK